MNPSGFYISKLSVSGPGKPPAELEFIDGLNVVCGASDTGKSFAVSCIDFAFGASKSPRPIPEVSGYQTVERAHAALLRDGGGIGVFSLKNFELFGSVTGT
jgi:hypothetical protein